MFQQPFVPQDLWQMPMTLEWDWADMTSGFAPEDGLNMNGVLNGVDGAGSGAHGGGEAMHGVNGHGGGHVHAGL